MAEKFLEPQNPLKKIDETTGDINYVYPLTTDKQVIMSDGTRLNAFLENIEIDGNFVYLSANDSDAEDTTSGVTALVDADTLGGIPAKQYATKEELNTGIANIQNFLGTQVTYSLSGTTLTITTK